MQNAECRTKTELAGFLRRLRELKIFHRLGQHRDDAIMVEVNAPGERWKVEFLEDGSVDVEVFRSNGEIQGEQALQELLKQHSDAR